MTLSSAVVAFQQRGVFTVPDVTRGLGFTVSSEGPPNLVALYDKHATGDRSVTAGIQTLNLPWLTLVVKNK